MKRLLLLAALLASTGAYSRTLTPDEALQRVYADYSGRHHAPAAQRPALIKTVESPDKTPAVYLFGTETGDWMAVGASDIAAPLLGYGANAAPDRQLPPQMEWWLSEYSRRIQWADSVYANSHGRLKMPESTQKKNALKRAEMSRISPLLTTTWDQGEPYNMYAPEIDGIQAPTGCVATALAQVMKYHQYPAAGHGMGIAMTEYEQTLTMDLDVPLRWDDMLDDYAWTDYTQYQADAVAKLMQAVGYSCNMVYGLEGSGAFDINANRAMVENFDYAPSTWLYYRNHYTIDKWEEMLHQQLSEVGPVYYSGRSDSSGHAFVCDGYDGGYFHFNWGWGGIYDGLFLIDALTPDGVGTGGGSGSYNFDQMAMFGMQRPGENTVQPAPQLTQYGDISCYVEDNYPWLSSFFYNATYKYLDFTLGVEITDIANAESQILPLGQGQLDPGYGYTDICCWDNEGIKDGNYMMRVMTSTEDHPEWLPVLAPVGMETYGYFTVKDGVWSVYEKQALTIVDASAPTRLYIGEPSTYTVTLQNTNSSTTSADYGIYLCREIDGTLYIVGVTEKEYETFEVAANSTETFEAEFKFTELYNGFDFDTELYLLLANPETLNIEFVFDPVTVGNNGLDFPVQYISINPEEWEGKVGDAIQLEAMIYPTFATCKKVEWQSSNPEVATVDENGLVELVGAGSSTITASTTDGSDLYAYCHVTASAEPLTVIDGSAPTRIYAFEPSTYTLTLQNTNNAATSADYSLYLCMEGDDGYLHIVGETENEFDTFEVAPNSTETFEQEFTFTLFYEGFELDTEMYLVLVDPVAWEIVHFFDNVTVGYHEPVILAEEIYLTPDAWYGEEGDVLQLEATILPEDATCKDVMWTSSDTNIAIVDQNGLVEILHAGDCVITATTVDGSDLSAECYISVTTSVKSLIDENMPVDVYGADGKVIMRQVGADQTDTLPTGLYIIRQGSKSKTIILTK